MDFTAMLKARRGSGAYREYRGRYALPDLSAASGQDRPRRQRLRCSIITLDNGVYKIWFARNYTARVPNSVLLDNALATMGAGLPSAMASAMVYPKRKVMAICGDGGFM